MVRDSSVLPPEIKRLNKSKERPMMNAGRNQLQANTSSSEEVAWSLKNNLL